MSLKMPVELMVHRARHNFLVKNNYQWNYFRYALVTIRFISWLYSILLIKSLLWAAYSDYIKTKNKYVMESRNKGKYFFSARSLALGLCHIHTGDVLLSKTYLKIITRIQMHLIKGIKEQLQSFKPSLFLISGHNTHKGFSYFKKSSEYV